MAGEFRSLDWLLGISAGFIGGALGYFAFFLAVDQGFYAIALPGALTGLGCGLASGMKSNVLGVGCGLVALSLGLFVEWRFAPFRDDAGFAYFLTHVHQLKSMTLILIGVGGALAFWFGRGRPGGVITGRHNRFPRE